MKKLLNYLPSWNSIKRFLSAVFYGTFMILFFMKVISITFFNYVVSNNDVFMALMFIALFLLDIYDAMKK
jgi:hypothetical protein